MKREETGTGNNTSREKDLKSEREIEASF